MNAHKHTIHVLSSLSFLFTFCSPLYAQQNAAGGSTSGASSPITTSGSASPSANVSTATTGGTNINYQTNNAYNNENGFAPGIFCRTPTLYVGGNFGESTQANIDTLNAKSEAENLNYSAQIGLLIPFGSSIIKNCAELANQITVDRKISTELSMIRACASLEKEGIAVDPEVYPLLEKCAKASTFRPVSRVVTKSGSAPVIQQAPVKIPKTNKS